MAQIHRGDLHSFQVEGVNWLRHAHTIGKHVILADEMGLGKTVQTLAYLASVERDRRRNKPWSDDIKRRNFGSGRRGPVIVVIVRKGQGQEQGQGQRRGVDVPGVSLSRVRR